MSEFSDDVIENLTAQQRTRIVALREARTVLRNGGVFNGGEMPAAGDLADLAEYILTGAVPVDTFKNESRTEA